MRFAPPLRPDRESADSGTSRAALINSAVGNSFLSPRKGRPSNGKPDGSQPESTKPATIVQIGGKVPTLAISQMQSQREEKENLGHLSARSFRGQSDAAAAERMVHSARSLSPQRRTRLQRMLEREGLKEALSTLLQATSPRKKWDPALVEDQVDKLLGGQGNSLHPSPSKVRPAMEAQTSQGGQDPENKHGESPIRARPARDLRPATAGVSPTRRSQDLQRGGAEDQGRPSTASAGSQRGQLEGGVKREDDAQERSLSPRKAPLPRPGTAGGVEQKGDSVQLMPTYTVAGKRMPLIQLLREKIWQRSPGGAHQLLKCFNQLDRDHSGAISQDEMRRFLATFHVDVDPRTLHAFVSALDANKDGNIDYEDFVQKLLPEDFPGRNGMGRFGGGQENYLITKLNTARAFEARRRAAVQQWQSRMSVDDLERLMREKLEGRVRGGPSHLRKAFRYLDRDGDGKLSPAEFQLMLGTFNINPSPDEYAALLARYDPNGDGVIDYYEFIDKLMPPEFETKKQMAQRRAEKMQAESSKRLEFYEQAFREAAAPPHPNGAEASVRLSLESIRKACADKHLPLDDEAMQLMADTCRASADGKLDVRQFAQQLRAAADRAVAREVLHVPRDLMAGFGNPADGPAGARAGGSAAALVSGKRPMTLAQVAEMFNEKVAGRFHGRGPQEDMRMAFAHFDVTGRGKLDHADVSRAFQNFNMRLTASQKQELLAKLDPEQTGFVTFAAFDTVLGTKPDLGFFPEKRPGPFVPLQKNGRPFTATPRVNNVSMEVWGQLDGSPQVGPAGAGKEEEPATSPRRLIMTPRSALQSSNGTRPQTSQSLAGRRPGTTSPVASSEDGSVDGGQKNRRPSGRSSSGLLYRSPYAAESSGVLRKPSRHPGGNAPLPNLPVASRPSTAASAAKPQNFDFGGLTPR